MNACSYPSVLLRAGALLLCLLSISITIPQAHGALRIWDGSSSSFWSDLRNWVFDTPLGTGDLPVFPPGPRLILSNDFANLTLHSLLFTGPGYVVQGNALTLTNGLHASHESGTTRILIPTMFTGASSRITTSNANATLIIEGPLKYPVSGLTFDVTGRIEVSNTVSQIIGGAQTIQKFGTGTLELAASNTFGGALFVRDGTVFANHDAALGNVQSQGTIVSEGATLLIGGGLDLLESSINVAGSLALNMIGSGGSASRIWSAISFTGTNATIDVPITYLGFNGPLSGPNGFRLLRGDLVINSNNPAFSGTAVLELNSRLTVHGQQPLSPVHLNGGWLTGDGAVGGITSISGGFVRFSSPFDGLTCGDVTLNPNTTYEVSISKQATVVSSRLDVHGTVSLNSCELVLDVNSQSLVPGDIVTLIQNDGTDPVNGTFSGLPEGTSITNGLTRFRISYAGGDGNDVTMAVVPYVRAWDGGAMDDNWRSDGNWNPNAAPHVGDNLVFPAGAARLSNSNNFSLLTSFNSLLLEGAGYTMRGTTILLNAGILATYSAGTSTVSIPLRLASNQTFQSMSGGILSLTTNIETNAKELTLDGDGIRISGAISQTGSLVKTGAGVAVLTRSNTYSGPTVVAEGTLQITSNAALGVASNGTTVQLGATLSIIPGLSVAEVLTLTGTLRSEGSGTSTSSWTGPITLVGPSAAIEVESAPLLITNVISGSGSLTKLGGGLLHLRATNTFTGATVLSEGALMVDGVQPQSVIQFNGGSLKGSGVVGQVFAAGTDPKLINPGAGTAPGTRTLSTGNIVFNSFTTFGAELDGAIAGSNHDQLIVRGTVSLNGCRLVANAGAGLAVGQILRIVDNDGVEPITGIFGSVPEGGRVAASNGMLLRVSYRGGDGNDVEVVVENPPSTITNLTNTPEGFVRIWGQGLPNVAYTLEASVTMHPGDWSLVTADLSDGAGIYEFVDVDAMNYPQRFYRVFAP